MKNNSTSTPNIQLLLSTLYANRGIDSGKQINYNLDQLLHFNALKGIDTAIELLITALNTNKKIVIVGDFDVDGATSTTLLVSALTQLGYKNINFLIPKRLTDGYGLTPSIVNNAQQRYAPDLIITVDNGISSIEGVLCATKNNIQTLITDHHLPGKDLPPADAIVNPNQAGCQFKSKNLAGVGVAFYLILALRAKLKEQGYFDKYPSYSLNMSQFLDIVALGTIADVVVLDHNNRILAQQGLDRIRAGKARMGLKALLEIAYVNYRHTSSSDLSFNIAPRLNAAGRLDDMNIGIHCLLANNYQEARQHAITLENLNKQRRAIQKNMYKQALQEINALSLDNELDQGVCLFNKAWHKGLTGIIASNIKEKVYKPIIVFTQANETELVGSARSIAGLHIRDLLERIATNHPHLLQKFGGHAMAAGMTIRQEHYADFVTEFKNETNKILQDNNLQQQYYSDGELDINYLNCATALILRTAAPWGNGFPPPCFTDVFCIQHFKILAEYHIQFKLTSILGDISVDAIWFYAAEKIAAATTTIKINYTLDTHNYCGQQTLQLLINRLEILNQ